MKITVIVPTYRRPKDLARCLQAIEQQTRPVDEVLVVVRDTDTETQAFIAELKPDFLPLQTLQVDVPGVVAAMNIGLDAASGEIVAFTDDDAAPHRDWLERIESYFLADPKIGAVGGRDWVYHGTQLENATPQEVVGKLQWFGRAIGNHHRGIGQAREVDFLKGVNMSFRREAIGKLRFDPWMRGTGAQVHFELPFCFALKRAGWKSIYDPQVAVNHYPAVRFDEDGRDRFNRLATINTVHNETLTLLEYLPFTQRSVFILWALLVGTQEGRGILQCLRFLPREGSLAGQKLLACWQGRWQGWQTWKQRTKPSPTL